jgi:hypothetical protein
MSIQATVFYNSPLPTRLSYLQDYIFFRGRSMDLHL